MPQSDVQPVVSPWPVTALRGRLIVAVALVVLLVFTPATWACICNQTETVAEALEHAVYVFSGEVVAVRSTRVPWFDTGETIDGYAYTFAVEKVWKGDPVAELVIVSGDGSGDCGYIFKRGMTYMVYADHDYMVPDEPPGTLYTSICSRTALLRVATVDLAMLPSPTAVYIHQRSPGWWMLLVGILLAFGSGMFIAMRRRKREGSVVNEGM